MVNVKNDQYGNQYFRNRSRLFFKILNKIIDKFDTDKVGTKLSAFTDINELTQSKDIDRTTVFYKYIASKLKKKKLNGKGPVYLSLQEPKFYQSSVLFWTQMKARFPMTSLSKFSKMSSLKLAFFTWLEICSKGCRWRWKNFNILQ